MPDISLDVLGLGELEADLQRLSKALANKAVRNAVMAGARLARDKTRQSAPIRSGKLKKNIVVTRQRGPSGAAVAGVSVKRPAGKKRQSSKPESAPYYWIFLEFGTSQMNAKPFLRPAWDNNLPQIEGAVRSKLAQAIDQALLRN